MERRSWLAELLLESYGDNKRHATDVQDVAWSAYQDIVASGGTPPESLTRLAKLGSSGKHKNNIKQELENYVKTLVSIVPVEERDIPLKISTHAKIGPEMLPHSYVPLHDWLDHLWSNYRSEFTKRLLGPPGRLTEYWNSVAPSDPRRDHPLFAHANYKTHCVPLILYGDGVPCTTRDSLQAVGVASPLTIITDPMQRLIFISGFFAATAVEATGKGKSAGKGGGGCDIKSGTKHAFWQYIVASFLLCEKGGEDGNMFAGYWFAIFQSKSD